MENELLLPGPAERDGPAAFERRCNRSANLALLNPFQFVQIVKQGWGQIEALRRWNERPPTLESYRQRTVFTLPFDDEWYVFNGGTDEARSHSWDLVGQRYAYDFTIIDESGRRHRSSGDRLEDYFSYGSPVRAPADGVIVEVRDGVRDAPRVGTGWLDWLCRDFGGNHVTIMHADREYSHLAHLVPRSIVVREGQRVSRGDVLARCGNSGHSTEPHLHFQVQDGPKFLDTMSLPVAFSYCVVDGEPSPDAVYLQRGARVRAEASIDVLASRGVIQA